MFSGSGLKDSSLFVVSSLDLYVAQNLSGTKTNNEILTFYFGYFSSVLVFLTP